MVKFRNINYSLESSEKQNDNDYIYKQENNLHSWIFLSHLSKLQLLNLKSIT